MTELLFTGAYLDPTFFFHSAMANIICTIIFGQRFNNQDPGFLRLLHLMNDISDLSSSFYSQVKPKVPWGGGGEQELGWVDPGQKSDAPKVMSQAGGRK